MTEVYGRSDEELATIPIALAPGLFAGKVVVVSGAGSGIGRAVAHWFARLGAKLVLCGRKAEKLEATAAGLSRYAAETLVHPLSIRDPEAVAAMFDAAWAHFGRVDILVNNAGGQFPQAAIDFSPKGWAAVIDTNLNGTWYMMQAAARKWRDAGLPGSIVNVATVIWRGMPGVAHTCAARAGVIYGSKTVAIEWAPLNIRVNCVSPGIIATEGMAVYSDEARAEMPNTNLMRRFGQVEDIANAVCYLAGDAGGFITGEVLTIDGGNQLWGDQWTIPKPDFFRV
ncbi:MULTISPECIES: SDR family oxidoreductase [Sphingomonas]|uniref:Peroxisomal trans-2-enoyl-CoA reductase n=1 Tax=Edaphosphingomonas fennica TaxID=114404 RepID=A0A2T4I4M5_9SPHN|nr:MULTISPECIES: SDR family oxidoreductase [Sphingomonas]AGH47880.1 short-chain dehydrogenase/reductase SDR [Sphingomonas sp. MM-1]MDX3882864.1 SDR family oxidoreductase [Sphingomonas sp.]PTD24451.1 short-chain dehydrogenase [Sphingomonas fennica]